MDTDQMNYQDMIDEAAMLAFNMWEWHEQFCSNSEESESVDRALDAVVDALKWLLKAKDRNSQAQAAERDALLNRIKTGTTTSRDAILAERLMP